jgi:hypothetical protein
LHEQVRQALEHIARNCMCHYRAFSCNNASLWLNGRVVFFK